jgi:heptosyltransferase-2
MDKRPSTQPPRTLWVRAPNWLGDLVMATPVLLAAARDARFERVWIGLRKHLLPVLAEGPLAPLLVPLGGGASEGQALRERRPEAALLLSNSFGAAQRVWLARVPWRGGAALSNRGPLLTHRVVPPAQGGRRVPIPTAHLQRDVAGLLSILVDDLHPRLTIAPASRERARALRAELGLDPEAPYLVCAPGAAFGASKLWPAEHFAAALDALAEERGWRALLCGAPSESPILERVASLAKSQPKVVPAEQRDLRLLAPWIEASQLLLVGDSGPRWIAAALDVPCVSVMGPNFPELTATSLEFCEVLRVEGLECAPCLERRCPLGHHRCLRDLSPERVVAAALRVVEKRAACGPPGELSGHGLRFAEQIPGSQKGANSATGAHAAGHADTNPVGNTAGNA